MTETNAADLRLRFPFNIPVRAYVSTGVFLRHLITAMAAIAGRSGQCTDILGIVRLGRSDVDLCQDVSVLDPIRRIIVNLRQLIMELLVAVPEQIKLIGISRCRGQRAFLRGHFCDEELLCTGFAVPASINASCKPVDNQEGATSLAGRELDFIPGREGTGEEDGMFEIDRRVGCNQPIRIIRVAQSFTARDGGKVFNCNRAGFEWYDSIQMEQGAECTGVLREPTGAEEVFDLPGRAAPMPDRARRMGRGSYRQRQLTDTIAAHSGPHSNRAGARFESQHPGCQAQASQLAQVPVLGYLDDV